MTRDELANYIEAVRTAHQALFFIERFFRTDEEWERVAAHDFRHVSLSPKTETTLDHILVRRVAAILGEPGSGKSTVARAAVQRAIDLNLVPLVGQLRSYTGQLSDLLEQTAPRELVRYGRVDGVDVERALILDGVDEVSQEFVERFVSEIETALQEDRFQHIILSSRQAFFANNRSRFKNPPEAFYILGFGERDVKTFVEHQGGDVSQFLAEVERLRLSSETTNPFALSVLYQMFADTGALGQLRFESVDHVVESLVASRPQAAADRQRRALRMIAVAMETASRNELTIDEAVRLLQAATPVNAQDAQNLLNELTHSILIRTPNGIAFQMRSYGEYLAAVELKGMSLDRIQLLVNYERTGIPNESWRNCVSYLAELHPGVRRSFALRNPDWVIAASPFAFTEEERTVVVSRLLDKLFDSQQYVRRHRFLNPDALARFVTPEAERQLMTDAASSEPVRAGNAMAVLGARRVRAVLNVALPIALDRNRPQLFRESAISAVANTGDSSLIPTLLESLDPDDLLHLSLVDCIGALTDAGTIPTVLPILLRTEAMVSGAFYRFRELQSREAAQAFLDFMGASPTVVGSSRFGNYGDPLWETVREFWQPDWADTVADLLIAWERAHITANDTEEAIAAIGGLPDGGEQVGRAVLAKFLAAGEKPFYFSWTIGRWITPAVAEWLARQPHSAALMETAARFGTAEVRRVLAPYFGGLLEEQDQAVAEMRAADQARDERVKRKLAEDQQVVQTDQHLGSVLSVLSRLNKKDWPGLDDARKAWLSQECESWLQQIDPINSVRWISENQLSYNPALSWLVRAIDHYSLRIGNDVLLVQSMMASESGPIASYERREGLSAYAVSELERILTDPNTPSGAVYHLLGFLDKASVSTPALGAALIATADNAQRPEHIRSWAIRLAASKGVSDNELVALAGRLDGRLKIEGERRLIGRQHRPTIEREIAALLADDAAMRGGEVEPPHDSSLSWIGSITSEVFWPRLMALRTQALRLALPNVTGLITGTMSKIDGVGLAAVVREQIPDAPAEWREVQGFLANEYEIETRLRNAQATPFERVIQRLRGTTLGMFKIWCEGPTDGPTIMQFLAKYPGFADLEIVTDSLNGWNNILSPNWQPRLRDGCHDVIVFLDGDRGRDFTAPGNPLNANALRVREILAAIGIELIVLERYGLENYFSQAACEAVLGPPVAARFPLPLDANANLNHDKNRNPQIAGQMNIADLAGTDLLRILEEILRRSRV